MLQRWLTIFFCLVLWLECIHAAPPKLPLDPYRQEWKDFTLSLFYPPDYGNFQEAVLEKDLRYFHWTIDVSPQDTRGNYVDSFDVSNSIEIRQGHKETVQQNPISPEGKSPDFRFQYKYNVQPGKAINLQARIKIGTAQVSTTDVLETLQNLPLPGFGESCVDWAQSAIRWLQNDGMLRDFDVEPFFEKALEYGFERFMVVRDLQMPLEQIVQENAIIAELGEDGVIIKPQAFRTALSIPRKGKKPYPKHGGRKMSCSILKRDVCNDLVKTAEQVSKEGFDRLLEKFGHDSLAKFQEQLHLQLNSRLEKFSEVPRIKRITTLAEKMGTKALAIGGLALYVDNIVETFSRDMLHVKDLISDYGLYR